MRYGKLELISLSLVCNCFNNNGRVRNVLDLVVIMDTGFIGKAYARKNNQDNVRLRFAKVSLYAPTSMGGSRVVVLYSDPYKSLNWIVNSRKMTNMNLKRF